MIVHVEFADGKRQSYIIPLDMTVEAFTEMVGRVILSVSF